MWPLGWNVGWGVLQKIEFPWGLLWEPKCAETSVHFFLSSFRTGLYVRILESMDSIFALNVPSLGAKVCLTRVARGLGQINVAAAARVGQAEVSAFRTWWVCSSQCEASCFIGAGDVGGRRMTPVGP